MNRLILAGFGLRPILSRSPKLNFRGHGRRDFKFFCAPFFRLYVLFANKYFTHNEFCTPPGHVSCSPHFWRHATESINPTLRHTSCLHPTPHGCQIPAISRPNTAISSLLSALMPLHHNRFTLVHLPSPIQCELSVILNHTLSWDDLT